MENKDNKTTNNISGFTFGFICGLFLIFGLIGGFLYPANSLKREEFIKGWISGLACLIIGSILLAIILTSSPTVIRSSN